MRALIILLSLVPGLLAQGSSVYDGCGDTKGCFGTPSGCADNSTCLVLGTFRRADNGVDFAFEIFGDYSGVDDEEHYVAIGLSEDPRMGIDSVVACNVRAPVGPEFRIEQYWNTEGIFKSAQLIEPQPPGISNEEVLVEGGTLLCSFTRAAETVVEGVIFNLDENPYYVLISSGPLNSDGELRKHSVKAPSPTAIDFPQMAYLKSS